MSTDNCKDFLIEQYPTSKEGDWKRVKKFKIGDLSIREFENKIDGTIVQLSEEKDGEIKVFTASTLSLSPSSEGDKTKPNFDCVLLANHQEKEDAMKCFDEQQQNDSSMPFDLLKFLPQNYYFQICMADENDEYEKSGKKRALDCNKSLKELQKTNDGFFIAICNDKGVWYDEVEANVIVTLVCPAILSAGGTEGTIEIDDENLTPNDVVAFLERRGLKYIENNWSKIEMTNFRSKVNDNHVWAYPNPDLTPTLAQMWETVKSDFYTLEVYKEYMNLDMMKWTLDNSHETFRNKEFRKYLKEKAAILSDKEQIEKAVPSSLENLNSSIKPASKL